MVKSRLVRATAVAATSLGFLAAVTGIAGASSGMSTLDHTGPQSSNVVKQISTQDANVANTNHVTLASNNGQAAATGDAKVNDNTTGGGATTGDATNSNSVSADLTVSNSAPDMMPGSDGGDGSASSSVSNTGPQSTNTVVQVSKSSLDVSNDNSICLTTDNSQSASTGDATVNDNTTGGDATTGAASNTSSSSFTLSVTN